MPIGQTGTTSRLNYNPAPNNTGVTPFPLVKSVTNVTPSLSGLGNVVYIGTAVGMPSHFRYNASMDIQLDWTQLRFGSAPVNNDSLTTAQYFEDGYWDRTLSGNPGSRTAHVDMPANASPGVSVRAGNTPGTRSATLQITGAQVNYREVIPDLTGGGWTLLSDLVPGVPSTMRFSAYRNAENVPIATYAQEQYPLSVDILQRLYAMSTTVSMDGQPPQAGFAMRARVLDYRLATIFNVEYLPNLQLGFFGVVDTCGIPLGELAEFYGRTTYGPILQENIPLYDNGIAAYLTNVDWVDVEIEVYTSFGRVIPAFWTGFTSSYEVLGSDSYGILVPAYVAPGNSGGDTGGGDTGGGDTGGGDTGGGDTGGGDTGGGTTPPGAWYADDFETTSAMAGEWTYDTSWATSGTRSLRSKAIDNNGTTSVGFDFDATAEGVMTLDYRVSSEGNFDFLTIYLNGSNMGRFSGETSGTVTIPVAVGANSFQVTYSKDSNTAGGSDCAWIDNLVITGAGTITAYTSPQPAGGGTGGDTGGDTGGTTPVAAWYTDDFEGSSPMQGQWAIDTLWSSTGTRSLRSKTITHSQSTSVGMIFTMTEAGTITFDYKVSSEANYDYLQVILDNEQKYLKSGEVIGTATIPVGVGQHELQILYYKDSSASSGTDCAWIDNLRITGAGSITSYTSNGAPV